MAAQVVDWGLGRRVAGAVGRSEPGLGGLAPEAVRATTDAALQRVLDYTQLEPQSPIPEAETITREEWIESNLAELRDLAAPLEERAADEISFPWPVGGIVRKALGVAGGVEAGVVVGYAARRVLGQYQLSLADADRPPRMLLVGQNLANAQRQLDAERDGFLLWVAMHEQTHSVQFAAVPWLRDHLAGLLSRLIETASGEVDLAAVARLARRLVSSDPRRTLREALRGELAQALAGPEQAAIVAELQATMAVVEGYAEHTMDAAASDDIGLATMRERMDARRARRPGLAEMIARALGLGMKLRQYELGKAWSDTVVGEAGLGGLNRVWEGPEALPSQAELEAPGDWVARVSSANVA